MEKANETLKVVELEELLSELRSKERKLKKLEKRKKLSASKLLKYKTLEREIDELKEEIDFRESYKGTNFNNQSLKTAQQERIAELREKSTRRGGLTEEEWDELANLQTSINFSSVLESPIEEMPDLNAKLDQMEIEKEELIRKRGAMTPEEHAMLEQLNEQIAHLKEEIQKENLLATIDKSNPTPEEKEALLNGIVNKFTSYNNQLIESLQIILDSDSIDLATLKDKKQGLLNDINALKKFSSRKIAKEITKMEAQVEAIEYFFQNYTDIDSSKEAIKDNFALLYGQNILENEKNELFQSIINAAETYNSVLHDILKKKHNTSMISLDSLNNTLRKSIDTLNELKNNNQDGHNDKAIAELQAKIESIEDSIKTLSEKHLDIDAIKLALNELYEQNTSKEEIIAFLNNIIDQCAYYNDQLISELEDKTGLKFNSFSEIEETKENLSNTLQDLKTNNTNGENDEKIAELEETIKTIKNFKRWFIDIDTNALQNTLLKSFSSTIPEEQKEEIRQNLIEALENPAYQEELEENLDDLKKRTKRKNNEKTGILNRHKKKLAIIGGSVVLATILTFLGFKYQKEIKDAIFQENNNKNTPDSSSMASLEPEVSPIIDGIEPTPAVTTTPTATPNGYSTTVSNEKEFTKNVNQAVKVIKNGTNNINKQGKTAFLEANNPNAKTKKQLIEIGYEKNVADKIVENFETEQIDKILDQDYDNRIEFYVNEKDFHLHNLNNYEDARNKFNLTASETVDYVNRASCIWATHFYEDADVLDITETIISIDNKDLFTTEHANLAQGFNTSFNRIVDNYLTGSLSEKDIQKMGAIKYFAKEGTDMADFLNEFEFLSIKCLQNDPTYKTKMFDFINIFATSLNGFTNEKSALTDNEQFNKSAQVNDYFNWYILYDSFVKPLYPVFSNEESFAKFEELQILMETALQGPEFQAICGQSRTLGAN